MSISVESEIARLRSTIENYTMFINSEQTRFLDKNKLQRLVDSCNEELLSLLTAK